ncbi:uncharacterized protein LOC101833796 isoform X1 [Mesocricetus auratus]|uniref:Uncharacterized protein LOC101833796 isoform X1 n=1 Tax=Mesocricetus auratus TaxID=10036 RepID=A0ABM2Y8N9_MESAU|nr:uncharacterized protein LOC101833796 isoform X1 [Mesocricetus auratus]
MSVCSRIEDKASFKTQQDIPEDILKNGADDSPIPSRQYKSIEAQEEEAELEPIQDLNLESENVYKKSEGYQKLETSRKVTHSFNIRNDTEKNQVWAYKCLHPELRDYSHPTSKPESEPQESQPDLSEELKEEIPKSELQNESFDKSAKNQEFGVSDANELQELYTEVPCSSNTNNDAGKNVMRHLENN